MKSCATQIGGKATKSRVWGGGTLVVGENELSYVQAENNRIQAVDVGMAHGLSCLLYTSDASD